MRNEIAPLRESIVRDFNAILNPPPLYYAPLLFLERIQARNRKAGNEAGGEGVTNVHPDDTHQCKFGSVRCCRKALI
jgi:hypothetical protein